MTLTHTLTTQASPTILECRDTAKASNQALKMTLSSVRFSSPTGPLNSNSLVHRLDRN